MNNKCINQEHSGFLSNLNAPDPQSPEFASYMMTLHAKTAAFDNLISSLNEAGFDTSNMSYDDTANFLKELSLEGAEAYALSLISKIHSCYVNTIRLEAEAVANSGLSAESLAKFDKVIGFIDGLMSKQSKIEAELSDLRALVLSQAASSTVSQPQVMSGSASQRAMLEIFTVGATGKLPNTLGPDTQVFIKGLQKIMSMP